MFCKKEIQKIFALEEQLADLCSIHKALDNSMAVIRFQPDGTIVSANENFARAMGYGIDELSGQHHRIFCDAHYASSNEYQQFWQRLGRGEFYRGTIKRQLKSGQDVWLEATYSPIRNIKGQVTGVIKLASDVTEQIEQAAAQKAKVDAVERSMAVIEFTLTGEILRANNNFTNTMGYAEADIVGKHHRLFCLPEYASSAEYQAFWGKLAAGEFVSGQFQRIDRAGNIVWLEASYTPVAGPDGQPVKVVKFASDITAQINRHDAERQGTAMAYDVASQTQDTSAIGEKVIFDTVAKMHAIEQVVGRSAEQVTSLGEQTSSISFIVNTIREIADQTNLLALNAAIEAARAGESGRGFAVVADEVRSLAERTSKATAEVSQMIEGINIKSAEVTDCMSQGLNEVAEGVELVNQAGDAISQMREGANRVVSVIQQLSETVSKN